MSGVAAVCYKLIHYSDLTNEVPAARIYTGDIPIGTALPAIGVKQISSVPRLNVALNLTGTLHTDRVQVTVMVKKSSDGGGDYPQLRALLRLVYQACPMKRGNVNGIAVDSIIPETEGPDLPSDEVGIISGSRDFFARYTD